MEAHTLSGRVDVPITTAMLVIIALIGLWGIHKLTITIG